MPIRKHHPALLSSLLMAAFPPSARAGGLLIFVSTPVTPPRGWLWVPAGFAIGLVACEWVCLRKYLIGRRFACLSCLSLAAYWLIFFVLGQTGAMFGADSLGSLDFPHHALRGLAWREVAGTFVFWNAVGLALLVGGKIVLLRRLGIWRKPMRWAVLGANACIYLVALLPFVLAHSPTHGWAGEQVDQSCLRKVRRIAAGLVLYAQWHGGKLPDVDSIEDVIREIEPYLESPWPPAMGPIDACDLACIRTRGSGKFYWNPAFAGARVSRASGIHPDDLVISCPMVHDSGKRVVLRYHHLLEINDLPDEHIEGLLDDEGVEPPIQPGYGAKNP